MFDSATLWTAVCQASLSNTNSQSLLKLTSIELVMPSIICYSLLILPQSFPASGSFQMSQFFTSGGQRIGVSASTSVLWWIFMTDFLYDWLDLLAVQVTLKSLLQHHSSKASILQHSAFFMVQLSPPYMTIGKTRALTRWTFVGKLVSLLFNMLSRFVIAFLPRSKRLLISRLQSPSAVILEHSKIKSLTVSTVSSYLSAMKWWDQMPWSSLFQCWVLSQLFHFYQEALQFPFPLCHVDFSLMKSPWLISLFNCLNIQHTDTDRHRCFP